jgi:hypothetical protein
MSSRGHTCTSNVSCPDWGSVTRDDSRLPGDPGVVPSAGASWERRACPRALAATSADTEKSMCKEDQRWCLLTNAWHHADQIEKPENSTSLALLHTRDTVAGCHSHTLWGQDLSDDTLQDVTK